ncbi:unnamed protein product [Diatraea saccharalis]|uniref:Uncharacterized protein n=1 Tax=Diatraea saccharalis TaxID=40085 RepID=A0A9N9WCJ6_9NEOP|nr:unnamed protein product [Diatraea saccharalis]
MSGGSQHNPNGRQSQLGPGWSPLQRALTPDPTKICDNRLIMLKYSTAIKNLRVYTSVTGGEFPGARSAGPLADRQRGHVAHADSAPTPLPCPGAFAPRPIAGNEDGRQQLSVPAQRHAPGTVPAHADAARQTSHESIDIGNRLWFVLSLDTIETFFDANVLSRHTPSPGDVKTGAPVPQLDLYPHLGPGRDKLVRPEELLAYARVGVDLSLSGRANGSPASPALSVRDAPTINSLIARAASKPPVRPAHARVDALLERLAPAPAPAPAPALAPAAAPAPAHAPASPLSVIVHPRAAPTPSPPSSNEDSADSCGAPPGSKRKRKPERTIRVPSAPAPAAPAPAPAPAPCPPLVPSDASDPAPAPKSPTPPPVENGDAPHAKSNGPEKPPTPPPPTRRKTRSGSAETIDDIAAMIASTDRADHPVPAPAAPAEPVTVDNLKSVLASPEPKPEADRTEEIPQEKPQETPQEPPVEAAAAPRRRSARTSNSETANVPIESPSEAKPAEPETSGPTTVEPTAASFVEVENQLEKMFAGIEKEEPTEDGKPERQTAKAKKRRKSAPTKGDRKAARVARRASTADDGARRKTNRKKETKTKKRDAPVKDAYDSGSNASSSRSRGPYIQIRGPRDSPLSVSVINASTGEEEEAGVIRRKGEEFRNGLRARGLHASTLGLRYDATTPDATWRCAFCERGPHAAGLGDLFGPYTIDNDVEEYSEAVLIKYVVSFQPPHHVQWVQRLSYKRVRICGGGHAPPVQRLQRGVVPRVVRRVGAGRGGVRRARVGPRGRGVGGARARVPALPPPRRAPRLHRAPLPRARASALRPRAPLAAGRGHLPGTVPRTQTAVNAARALDISTVDKDLIVKMNYNERSLHVRVKILTYRTLNVASELHEVIVYSVAAVLLPKNATKHIC